MRSNPVQRLRSVSRLSLVALALGCSDPVMMMPEPEPPTLETDAVVTYAEIYASGSYTDPAITTPRPWIPVDLGASAAGELWIVQQMQRDPRFDDTTECVAAVMSGAANDCSGLQGSTVAIADPRASTPAVDGTTARLVVDYNSWHFMRRPSSIAFGDPNLVLDPADFEGATNPDTGAPLLTSPVTYTNTFATCHEHRTGNFTDQSPFIGPALWTTDPAIYTGAPGTMSWEQNGSHLDMVHATPYCMGIAYDSGNVYWTFNGEVGMVDRYDFRLPHVPGHYYHDDAIVTRYDFGADALARLPGVPSNMMVVGEHLYIADTGNGRVVRFGRATGTVTGAFRTHEGLDAEVMTGMGLETVLSAEVLGGLWGGGRVEPSGLEMLDADTLVVGNYATGHITLVDLDGTVLRTLDTGLGEGLAGITVIDGTIYFAHTVSRRVYRVDVDTTMRVPSEA
jgi:hypothetical protein